MAAKPQVVIVGGGFGGLAAARFAPGLETLDDALEIRRRLLFTFEQAEREGDPEARHIDPRLSRVILLEADPRSWGPIPSRCRTRRRRRR